MKLSKDHHAILSLSENKLMGAKGKHISTGQGLSNFSYQLPFQDDTLAINENFSVENYNNLSYCYDNRDFNLTIEGSAPKLVYWRGNLNSDGIEDLTQKIRSISGLRK